MWITAQVEQPGPPPAIPPEGVGSSSCHGEAPSIWRSSAVPNRVIDTPHL